MRGRYRDDENNRAALRMYQESGLVPAYFNRQNPKCAPQSSRAMDAFESFLATEVVDRVGSELTGH